MFQCKFLTIQGVKFPTINFSDPSVCDVVQLLGIAKLLNPGRLAKLHDIEDINAARLMLVVLMKILNISC